jgi:hypothetical protein
MEQWAQKIGDNDPALLPIRADWVWSKIKIQRCSSVHRVYFIKRRGATFTNAPKALSVMQALNSKAMDEGDVAELIIRGMRGALPVGKMF